MFRLRSFPSSALLQAPETYTRKRDKNKNKNKKTGPLTTTSPQPGAERGAKRTRSSTNDPGGGAWIAPNDEQAVVAGPGEDEDAEGTDDEEEERDEDEGAAEGAAALAELMEAGKGGGGRGEVSPALRLPNLSSGVERPSGRGEGEGAGRTSQPSYRSAGGSSSNSSWSTSQQPTPSSSGEPRRRHQPSNDYPASFLDGSPHSSYQRRDSNYGSSSSHHHASSSNSYFPPSNSSSTSYTHYPSNQVGAPYSSSSSGHLAEGPPRLSYSNPTLPSNASTGYQLPPLNPQAQQPYPLQLPPPPAVPPFSAMHIAEPAPRHFHVQGGWDRSPDVGHSSLLGPRRESAERGGGPGEERGRFESDERRGQRVQEEEEEEGLDDQRDGGRGGERRRWAGGG